MSLSPPCSKFHHESSCGQIEIMGTSQDFKLFLAAAGGAFVASSLAYYYGRPLRSVRCGEELQKCKLCAFNPVDFKEKKVFLVGSGCGGVDLLTMRALNLIRHANVLVMDELCEPVLPFCSFTQLCSASITHSGNNPIDKSRL